MTYYREAGALGCEVVHPDHVVIRATEGILENFREAYLVAARALAGLRAAGHGRVMVVGPTEDSRLVLQAVRALEAGQLAEMGALMNASHQSLAEDFDCSTSRLDRMVSCARRAGALGARLTGAGFGGSIVALCHADDAQRVIAALDREYYSSLLISPESARAVLHAGAGAGVLEPASA